jgi:hypothetical protein
MHVVLFIYDMSSNMEQAALSMAEQEEVLIVNGVNSCAWPVMCMLPFIAKCLPFGMILVFLAVACMHAYFWVVAGRPLVTQLL